ncbi:hypothetical protein DKY63_31645 [Pseudomonas putida]|uniref:Uncharacterized protein n=1 Tax=Pseudomonas putida TaxID=303 RepID=A0A2Z4RSY8_PSEPU|nr:hypothetical protein DKY63_31645 [Pseudomonas putida]
MRSPASHSLAANTCARRLAASARTHASQVATRLDTSFAKGPLILTAILASSTIVLALLQPRN